jgi:hypothetical protein
MVHHPLVAFLEVSVGDQPADVSLHGADVAFGVVGDGPGGRVGAAAVLVGVVGVAEKDSLRTPLPRPIDRPSTNDEASMLTAYTPAIAIVSAATTAGRGCWTAPLNTVSLRWCAGDSSTAYPCSAAVRTAPRRLSCLPLCRYLRDPATSATRAPHWSGLRPSRARTGSRRAAHSRQPT